MPLSSASGEEPRRQSDRVGLNRKRTPSLDRPEEHTDSEGVIRQRSRIVSIVSSSMSYRRGLLEYTWLTGLPWGLPESDGPPKNHTPGAPEWIPAVTPKIPLTLTLVALGVKLTSVDAVPEPSLTQTPPPSNQVCRRLCIGAHSHPQGSSSKFVYTLDAGGGDIDSRKRSRWRSM